MVGVPDVVIDDTVLVAELAFDNDGVGVCVGLRTRVRVWDLLAVSSRVFEDVLDVLVLVFVGGTINDFEGVLVVVFERVLDGLRMMILLADKLDAALNVIEMVLAVRLLNFFSGTEGVMPRDFENDTEYEIFVQFGYPLIPGKHLAQFAVISYGYKQSVHLGPDH